PYEGITPLDFRDSEETTRLEVTAVGPWQIEVRPLTSARVIEAPGSLSGIGDEVLFIDGEPDTALISGNAAGRHFAVHAYGDSIDLLVNTTDPYEGRVIVPRDALLLEITAEGAWEVTFE